MRCVRVLRGVVVGGAALAAAAGGVPAALAAGEPRAGEADLAYHGDASMSGGRVDLRVTPRNHGPSDVADATVRVRWSTALEVRQTLPAGCARADVRTVLCGTGALPADGAGEQIRLRVRLRGAPTEVRVDLETVWTGDTADHNRVNDRQHVLVLDTGDAYSF
ncbi:hypothetical protein ACIQU5_25970 [Streptomyces sp. NPDC090306]|uniref:hypothetical protein n=1 Tax=unclassified Streptomyces TaxID=2593676 RepID=UPI0036ECE233